MIAPFICSFFMKILGPNGLFIFLFIFLTIIGLFGIYRMTKRSTDEITENENTFTPLPRNITPAGMELNPVTEINEEK